MGPVDYLLTDLTNGELNYPDAWGLNSQDQAVGDAKPTSDPGDLAEDYLGWMTANPGSVSIADGPGAISTHFMAINDPGDSVGMWVGGNNLRHGFLYNQGQFTDLNSVLGTRESAALDINNGGIVVGWADWGSPGNPRVRGFIYDRRNDSSKELDPLEGLTNSVAKAINAGGDVVGSSGDGVIRRPFLYSGGVMRELTGQVGGAADINDHGHVVGAVGPGYSPFFWADGNLVPIPVTGSASALNNNDEVTGSGINGAYNFAWHFTTADGLLDLNTALAGNYGISIGQAYAINDQGHIAAFGLDADNHGHAVLLTPRSPFRGPRRFQGLGNIVALVADILFGITQDGPGLARLGNQPIPVGPWGQLSERQREELQAKAVEVLGRVIDDPELRQQAVGELHQILSGEQG